MTVRLNTSLSTSLNTSQISTLNAMWTLISQADEDVQKELYARLQEKQEAKHKTSAAELMGVEYVKSLAVGKGKVPVQEDGKGIMADVKYGMQILNNR